MDLEDNMAKNKENKMLKKLQSQPSAKNISSKVVTATGSVEPSGIISKKYANEPLDIAKKATEFDESIDDLVDILEKDLPETKIPKAKIPKAKLPKPNQIYSKTGKIINISKVGKGAAAALKIAGKAAGPLAIASDALASSDLGGDDLYELQKAKEEASQKEATKKMFGGDKEKLKKWEEAFNKPLSASDVLKIKKLEAQPSKGQTGEQPSPDLEEMDGVMNYADYLKKKKRSMGYE